MDWFGNKKTAEERKVLERRLAEMEARANATHAIALCLLRTMKIEQRLATSLEMQKFLDTPTGDRSPQSVPDDYHPIYLEEFRRVIQAQLKYEVKDPAE